MYLRAGILSFHYPAWRVIGTNIGLRRASDGTERTLLYLYK